MMKTLEEIEKEYEDKIESIQERIRLGDAHPRHGEALITQLEMMLNKERAKFNAR